MAKKVKSKKDACYHKVKSRYDVWPCVPVESSEALTVSGWKKYDELKIGDKILSYQMSTDSLVWDEVLDIHHFEKAPIIAIEKASPPFSLESTPNHKWVVYDRNFGRKDIIPDQVYKDWNLIQEIKSGNIKIADAYRERSRIDYQYSKYKNLKSFEDYVELRKCCSKGVHFRTTKELMEGFSKKLRLVSSAKLNEDIQSEYNFNENLDKYGQNQSEKVLKMDYKQARIFFDSAIIYDGNQGAEPSKFRKSYESWGFKQKYTDHRDSFVFSAILSGYRVKYGAISDNNIQNFSITSRDYHSLDTAYFSEKGEKEVWCPQTNEGTWVMRQNGFVTITGNSAYASGALAKCRKVGAKNWGNKSKKKK